MLDNLFKEQFGKNNILSNISNMQEILHYSNFLGVCEVPLNVKYEGYGYIYFDIKSVSEEIVVTYNNIVVFRTNNDSVNMLPIKFIKNAIFQIEGACKNILIHIYGCSLKYKIQDSVLPQNNILVSRSGEMSLYSYSSVDDILNDNLVFLETFDSKNFVQTYLINGENYIGKLLYKNGVYFCTNIDNYTNKILVTDSADMAIFLQNNDKNYNTIVYIKDNKLYYKTIEDDNVISEENIIYMPSGRRPIQIISSILENKNSRIFGVEFDDNLFCLYIVKTNKTIEKIYEIKANNIRIHEKSNFVRLVKYNNYVIDVVDYEILSSNYGSGVLSTMSSKTYINAIDYYSIGDVGILTSIGGVKSRV